MSQEAWPDLRKVMARVLTPSGWLTGTFHIPVEQPLIEFLSDPSQSFYKLTRVLLPSQKEALDFLAIQRHAVVLVVPADNDELVGEVSRPKPGTKDKKVAALFDGGVLKGTLPVKDDHRVSDELMDTASFFAVNRCEIDFDNVDGPVKNALLVCVHAKAILGVAEIGIAK